MTTGAFTASHPIDVVISPHASEAAAVGGAALVLQSELAPRPSSQRIPDLVGRRVLWPTGPRTDPLPLFTAAPANLT